LGELCEDPVSITLGEKTHKIYTNIEPDVFLFFLIRFDGKFYSIIILVHSRTFFGPPGIKMKHPVIEIKSSDAKSIQNNYPSQIKRKNR
jgi:hypothetical protein